MPPQVCDALGSQRTREGVVMHGIKATVIASTVIPGCPSGLDSVTMSLSVAMLAGDPRHRGGTTTRGSRNNDTVRYPPSSWMLLRKQRVCMNHFPLTTAQQEWQERTAEISARDIGPRAAEYDQKAAFPRASLHALRDAGLWAIRVPQPYGGSGLDLVTHCLIGAED